MKLIFVHGAGGYGEMWRYQRDHFKDSDAITLPGHPEGYPGRSAEEYADWLKEYIAQKNYRDVVVNGHSMGGAIAMVYALKYPKDLKALILTDTGARLKVIPMTTQALWDAIRGNPENWDKAADYLFRLVPPEFKEAVIKKRKEMGPAVSLNDFLCCHNFDIMDKVAEIKHPTLVICGELDEATPPKFSDFLANKIQGSKKVIIPGATHFLFAEKPQEYNKAIEEFIKSLA